MNESWDDIENWGLTMEDFTDLNKKTSFRRQERISSYNLVSVLFAKEKIVCVGIHNLITGKECNGEIQNISPTGIKILIKDACFVISDILRISLVIGTRKIFCKAKVVWMEEVDHISSVGIKFTSISEPDADFINSLHLAIHLK